MLLRPGLIGWFIKPVNDFFQDKVTGSSDTWNLDRSPLQLLPPRLIQPKFFMIESGVTQNAIYLFMLGLCSLLSYNGLV